MPGAFEAAAASASAAGTVVSPAIKVTLTAPAPSKTAAVAALPRQRSIELAWSITPPFPQETPRMTTSPRSM